MTESATPQVGVAGRFDLLTGAALGRFARARSAHRRRAALGGAAGSPRRGPGRAPGSGRRRRSGHAAPCAAGERPRLHRAAAPRRPHAGLAGRETSGTKGSGRRVLVGLDLASCLRVAVREDRSESAAFAHVPPGRTSPASYAATTACTRSRRPSLRRIAETWLLTVVSVT